VAAKTGGGDPAQNLSLRYAVDKAKAANMPKDTIEKAIKKGTGELAGTSFESVLYEGYGPAGVAVMVEALTDNRNRTAPEIKRIFERHGGSLGTTGCVNWMFGKKGLITVGKASVPEDSLLEIALAAGADDVVESGDVFEITCEVGAFEALKDALAQNEIPTEVAEISLVPASTVSIEEAATAGRIISLMEALEENDDVQNTYANFDITEQ
jgi:YebC/PmpR family DNA-binding regulatory protein